MIPLDWQVVSTVSPEEVAAYLRSHGWHEARRVRAGKGSVWIMEDNPEGPDILLPLDRSLRDYVLRIGDVFRTLAQIEGRSWPDILWEIQIGNSRKHELKIWPEHFAAVTHPDKRERKTVEVRKDDRRYQIGDVLVLCEWDPEHEAYTGRHAEALVTHVLRGWGLKDGWVALSILLHGDGGS